MKELKYKISLNGLSYSIIAVINEDNYRLLKKFNPHIVYPNLLIENELDGDVQNISLAVFEIKDVSKKTKEYVNDEKNILKKMLKKAKIQEENEYIMSPTLPNKEGYYYATLNNLMNPFNEREERLYFSLNKGWMADKDEELSYSWQIKHWQS